MIHMKAFRKNLWPKKYSAPEASVTEALSVNKEMGDCILPAEDALPCPTHDQFDAPGIIQGSFATKYIRWGDLPTKKIQRKPLDRRLKEYPQDSS